MTRRSIVAAISIFVHATVLFVLMTADLWRPISEWPAPRSAMAFKDTSPVRLDDIPLPAHKPMPRSAPARSSSSAAPIAPPPEIGKDIEPPAFVVQPERRGDGDVGLGSLGGPSVPPAPPAAIPAPPPQQTPIRLHSGILPPQKIVDVRPAYPAIARSAHVEGVVIIEATIDEGGNVVRTQVLRSIPLLDAAALDAVRQWKFLPTRLNGTAVPIVMTITVNFTLN